MRLLVHVLALRAVQGHPVYAPTVNVGGKSKRIVIPPSVAYNG
jgi:hypothetical protein